MWHTRHSRAEAQQNLAPLAPYVEGQVPVLVLEHLRVIDGKITVVESAKSPRTYPANAKRLNLAGKSVIPGLIGMHEHLVYSLLQELEGGLAVYGEASDSACGGKHVALIPRELAPSRSQCTMRWPVSRNGPSTIFQPT